ncbi:MAG: sugar ABC transporter permease [Thermofilum sp.]|jgi:multiple sugar transport system permease protein|uniref:carbohydrate ABC transporter permease n=1 Tax=Thermofilum sp. TaxID=1961369 RepID=UPI002587EA89|nr:sugar ABC transporter permease [Thermofilum sp.]MCI4408874.1 sugar ABC transporter permease [Thermofilum sp.]
MKLREFLQKEIFLLPGLVGLGVFLYALIYTIYMSFFRYKLGFTEPTFIGLQNFVSLFNDEIFRTAVFNTIYFVIVATTLELLYGILLASLLYWSKYRYLFLPLMLVPMLLPAVNIVVIWRFLLHPDYGIVNIFLKSIGLSPIDPLNDPTWAMPTIILMDAWQMTPFVMIIILAGLSTVPREIVTAARLDGANKFQLTTKILLPLTKNVIMAVLLLRLIDAFRIFAKVQLLTNGGPGIATETLELQIYNRGVRGLEIGFGSAMSVIFILLAMVVIIPYMIMVIRGWRR